MTEFKVRVKGRLTSPLTEEDVEQAVTYAIEDAIAQYAPPGTVDPESVKIRVKSA